MSLAYGGSSLSLLPPGVDLLISTHHIKVPEEFAAKNTPGNKVRLSFSIDKHNCVVLSSAQFMELLPPTEETKEAPPGESPAPQKRRYRKIEIPVETVGYGLSKEQLKAAVLQESLMQSEDDLIRETAAKRNDLESYLFTMRDKLDGPLKAYATNSERMQFQVLLDNTSNWLYDEGYDATKLVYARKLEELKQVGNKFESRSFEEQNRQQACDALRRQIDLCKTFSSSVNEEHAHITAEDKGIFSGKRRVRRRGSLKS